jgi:hypothetical protein
MALGTLGAIALGSAVLGTGAKVLGSGAASRAANRATDAQVAASNAAIEEQRAAREQMRQLLSPYVEAGGPALQELMGLAGLGGPGSQQAAFQQQEQSPLFQGMLQQGENAILQNASATGGLRGGNVQGALSQFRPALLNQFIEQQYGRLQGIAGMGQNAAAGVGAGGMMTANQIGGQLGNIGSAQAGGALARGQAQSNMFGAIGQGIGQIGGLFGGLSGGNQPTFVPGASIAPGSGSFGFGLNVPGTTIPAFKPPGF